MASIDAYNKESDNKVSSLNSKKDELAESGKKKVIEYQSEIQALRNQNTDYKDKIVKTDVGTFKFIAKSLGVPLDTAVNYFIWSIMLVFDPLAVCLILAYNTLVGKNKEKIVPSVTPLSTPTPEPTPTTSEMPKIDIEEILEQPSTDTLSAPTITPTPSVQLASDVYDGQLKSKVKSKKSNSQDPNEPILRNYERFSRPQP
jgi:hypothetical protein